MFFFITWNVRIGRVRASQRWLECASTGGGRSFSMKPPNHSASFCWGRISFLVYIIFRTPTKSLWSHHPPKYRAWTGLLSSMPTTQPTWHFLWGTPTSCLTQEISRYPVIPPTQPTWHFRWGIVLFTLGNRCTSCHATHATNAVGQRNLLVDIQHLTSSF